MKAMVLLAINGGLGNTDLGMLPIRAIDIDTGWLDYPRAKTAMPRRVPLWPETREAIRSVIEHRPSPNDDADCSLLFIGRRGQNYVGRHKGYRVTQEFARVCKKAGIEGRCFYDLRRTFQTIAERSRDLVAVRAIMGHAPSCGDMAAVYRQEVEDDRLRFVVDTVRNWLFSDESKC
jgi:integrase